MRTAGSIFRGNGRMAFYSEYILKLFRHSIATALFLLLALLTSEALGFHSGGVGNCSGCHSIHSASPASQQLLLSTDSSSICLNCHTGLGGANSPSVFSPDGSALTPGGDFYWLNKDFGWLGGQSLGSSHGHNIVASDYGLTSDPANLKAPGGSFPSALLGCTSCHDPHGQVGSSTGSSPISGSGSYGDLPSPGSIVGNYRLLGDAGYQPAGGFSFSSDAPIARQSSISKFQESDLSHVAYGTGMSEWCGNCHQGILNSEHRIGSMNFEHPAGSNEQLENEMVNYYNTYVRSGDFTGTAATAYLQFVPFEHGTSDTVLLDPHSTQGPSNTANVMCLTCHRAHASAFGNIGRWDFTASILVNSHPAIGDVGATSSDVYYSYYGRDISIEFGSQQGQFCEKCHSDGGMGM